MTKRTNPIIALCLLLALSATGCNTAPATPGVDPVSTAAYPNVVIDPSLEDVLVRSEPTVVPPTHDRPLQISVPIRSVSSKSLELEYRVIYYDRNGKQTNQYPIWKDFSLMSRARHVINANAINLDAEKWFIEIRKR